MAKQSIQTNLIGKTARRREDLPNIWRLAPHATVGYVAEITSVFLDKDDMVHFLLRGSQGQVQDVYATHVIVDS